MTHAIVGLGSNLGDRLETLEQAVARIASHDAITLVARARIYETEPIGPSEGMFLNSAIRIDTTLEPLALLDVLLEIEREFGRVRRVRWGARTLDLDILWLENGVFEHDRLSVPHPELGNRTFALAPLVDVMPEAGWAKAQLATLGGAPALFDSLSPSQH